MGRQMIKVRAGPTNNAQQFCGQKQANLSANTSQNSSQVCMRFLASTGLPTSHLLSLYFNVVQLIFF